MNLVPSWSVDPSDKKGNPARFKIRFSGSTVCLWDARAEFASLLKRLWPGLSQSTCGLGEWLLLRPQAQHSLLCILCSYWKSIETGEMVQWLRVHAALVEDPGLVSGVHPDSSQPTLTHAKQLKPIQLQGIQHALLASEGICPHLHKPTYSLYRTHIITINSFKEKKTKLAVLFWLECSCVHCDPFCCCSLLPLRISCRKTQEFMA